MLNSEFIKFVLERMFYKYFLKKVIWKLFLKRVKRYLYKIWKVRSHLLGVEIHSIREYYDLKFLCGIINKNVDVPEWLSGMTRNHVGFARAGSNPAVHVFYLLYIFLYSPLTVSFQILNRKKKPKHEPRVLVVRFSETNAWWMQKVMH